CEVYADPAEREKISDELQSGSLIAKELRLKKKDGSWFWGAMTAHAVRNAAGEGLCFDGFIEDITQRKQVEDELKLKEKILDGASDSIFLHDLEGHFLYVNEAAYRDRGYEKEELLASDLTALIAPEFTGVRAALLKELFAKGEIIFKSAHRCKDGSIMPVEIHARTIELGNETLILSAARDIGERQRAEEALRKSEELFRSLFKNMLNGFAYCKMLFEQNRPIDFLYLKVNSSFEALTGLTKVEGKKVSEVIPGIRESNPQLLEIYGRVALTGIPERFENYVEALKMWFSISVYSPEKGYFVAVFDVITERKQAEEELRSAAQKWRTTFDAIGDAVCLLDLDGRIQQCNQVMSDLIGKPMREIIGRRCCELIHGSPVPVAGCPLQRLKETQHREELQVSLRDRWLKVTVDPIWDEAGKLIGAVHLIADISKLKRSEEALRLGRERLQHLLTASPAMIYSYQPSRSYRTTFISDNVAERLGYDPQEILADKNFWIGHVHPEDAPKLQADLPRILETGQLCEEYRFRHKDGTYRWIRDDQRLVRDSAGNPLEVVGSWLDITARKQAEAALGRSLEKIRQTLTDTVEVLATTVETRDPYTAGHQRRVAHLACALSREMGFTPDRIEGMRVLGYLHDLGKIAIPAEILSRPGKISALEFNIIKCHPQHGYDIIKNIEFPWPISQAILQHHERLNGSGYPAGLSDPEIILEARILMVADVVEAMASHRPYRPAKGIDAALEEIMRNRGVLYDGEVVDVCVKLFKQKRFKFD
ncbi:MAG: PAS domain S-box protein, partial [Deltaproteobacteria bacterium]|nr:PAS domain S-box protein [Deltaproteobacteria bacterium]